ncbi:MAG: ATPase, T2SS/T4P/T4SS family [Pseudobdellovibrionaceae bacterium]
MGIQQGCHLIGIVGGKGGVGKSVFAANFALAIQSELRTQVLLVDADSKSVGDQNIILGLKPTKTLKELSQFTGTIHPQNLNTVLAIHPSGLGYLGAVRGPDESLNASPELAQRLLDNLSRIYKFIVVDLGNDLTSLQHSIIQEATALIMITTPEVLVVTQTQRLMNELMSATYPKDMIPLVINKASPNGLSSQAISTQLQMPILGQIPLDDMTTIAALQKYAPFVLTQPKAPITLAYIDLVRRLSGGVLQRLKTIQKPKIATSVESSSSNSQNNNVTRAEGMDPRTLMKLRVHQELIRTADVNKLLADTKGDESKQTELREKTKREITQIVDREAPDVGREDRSKVIKEILEESLGLGPLEDLLADPTVTEIMVNGYKKIFIERSGKIQLSTTTFTSNDHLRRIIERIVSPLGRQINNSTPYVDARLRDGSRVNAIIEPLSIDGPALTIRKFKKGGITGQQYVEYGTLSPNMIEFLRICVENGLNVVISGGTGSGKTTLLNMLSSFIPANERIVTVEDAAELQLQQEHIVRLETRPPSMDGSNQVTIRDLVKNTLRMRPDRIVVGECRDGAAMDMLTAMNTGHDGSMTTTHANSPRECLARLETLCLMSGIELPSKAIKETISKAVHLIVQISRLSDGSRKVLAVTEVGDIQGDTITLADIFKFKETGFDKNRKIIGEFQATGMIPKFIQKLSDKGVNIKRDLFTTQTPGQQMASQQAARTSAPANPPNTGIPSNTVNNSMVQPPKKTGS